MAAIIEINKEVIRLKEVAHAKIIDEGLGQGLEIRFCGNPEPIHILTDKADLEYHMLVKRMRDLNGIL